MSTSKPYTTLLKVSKKRKELIPAAVKNFIWIRDVGPLNLTGKCMCCGVESMSRGNFHAGHILAEIHGGTTHVDNLKPICALCNSSMGRMCMNDFKIKYGFSFTNPNIGLLTESRSWYSNIYHKIFG
jgi:hypothetical protein